MGNQSCQMFGCSKYILLYIRTYRYIYIGLVARTSTLCCVVVDAARNCYIISFRCLPAVDLVWIFFAWYGPQIMTKLIPYASAENGSSDINAMFVEHFGVNKDRSHLECS